MGKLERYTNVIMSSDFKFAIPTEQFERVKKAMENKDTLVSVSDVYDGSPIAIRVDRIEAVSIWTVEGQKVWAEYQEQVKEINEATEKPDWES